MVVHFNVFRPSLRVPSLPGARRAWALTCDLWVTGFISSLSPAFIYVHPQQQDTVTTFFTVVSQRGGTTVTGSTYCGCQHNPGHSWTALWAGIAL